MARPIDLTLEDESREEGDRDGGRRINGCLSSSKAITAQKLNASLAGRRGGTGPPGNLCLWREGKGKEISNKRDKKSARRKNPLYSPSTRTCGGRKGNSDCKPNEKRSRGGQGNTVIPLQSAFRRRRCKRLFGDEQEDNQRKKKHRILVN